MARRRVGAGNPCARAATGSAAAANDAASRTAIRTAAAVANPAANGDCSGALCSRAVNTHTSDHGMTDSVRVPRKAEFPRL